MPGLDKNQDVCFTMIPSSLSSSFDPHPRHYSCEPYNGNAHAFMRFIDEFTLAMDSEFADKSDTSSLGDTIEGDNEGGAGALARAIPADAGLSAAERSKPQLVDFGRSKRIKVLCAKLLGHISSPTRPSRPRFKPTPRSTARTVYAHIGLLSNRFPPK